MTRTDLEPDGRRAASAGGDGTPGVAIGLILVAVGALLLAGQLFGIGIEDIGWPLLVIAAGVVILVAGLVVTRQQGMAIGGTVVTTVGLVLLYQETTGRWETWAYAWALVGPAASGLGLLLWGLRVGNRTDIRNGTWGLLGGLAMFAIGFLFFEAVIGIGGDRLPLPPWLLPLTVIAIGIVVLGRAMLERREPDAP